MPAAPFPTDSLALLIGFFRGQVQPSKLDLFHAAVAVVGWLGGIVLAPGSVAVVGPAALPVVQEYPTHQHTDADVADALEALYQAHVAPEGTAALPSSGALEWLLPVLMELLSRLIRR